MILVATVEHSGTHSLLELLGWRHDGQGRDTVPLEEIGRARVGTLLNAHLDDSMMDRILAAAQRMPVVTTHRPADDIRASWTRRGRHLAPLEAQLANWQRLMACNPYIMHLGRPW